MRGRARWQSGVAALALVALSGLVRPAPALAGTGSGGWQTAWGSAMAWRYGTAQDATVRQIAPLTVGGDWVRVRLSDAFSSQPLTVGAATIGVQHSGAAVVGGTLRRLTFAGRATVSVPAGAVVTSDPVRLTVHTGQAVAVSVYVVGAAAVTVHPCCAVGTLSYFTPNGGGNHTESTQAAAFRVSSTWSRWVDAVEVSGRTHAGAIVAFGDSITDGFNTTLRWTDALAQRLRALPPSARMSVVNEGITANTLTATARSDALDGGGPPGIDRLDRDALSQPGISSLVLLLGTNDLYFGATAGQVIAGLRQVVARAHAVGVRVLGVTLLPRAGSEGWTPLTESYRLAVNRWIRTSGVFDAVLDLARVTADVYNGACQPARMFPAFDSGDHLHPNAAGQTAMADAIPTVAFGLPDVPPVPQLVPFTATPGCWPAGAVRVVAPTPRSARVVSPSPAPTAAPSASGSPTSRAGALVERGGGGRRRELLAVLAVVVALGVGLGVGLRVGLRVGRRTGGRAGGRAG